MNRHGTSAGRRNMQERKDAYELERPHMSKKEFKRRLALYVQYVDELVKSPEKEKSHDDADV